jgi:hypothetical protein
MADFQYTNVPGKLKEILDKIREIGLPKKASQEWLKTIGFKSTNDRSLLAVLKFINFTDSSGVPSDLWSEYRGKNSQKVLARAIIQGYSELFDIYPDAWKRNTTDLEHVFSTKTTAGKQVISRAVRTFQSLCGLADFNTTTEEIKIDEKTDNGEVYKNNTENVSVMPSEKQLQNTGNQSQPSIHLNIQIHISPESTPDQIDKIFSSMAKHLYKS